MRLFADPFPGSHFHQGKGPVGLGVGHSVAAARKPSEITFGFRLRELGCGHA